MNPFDFGLCRQRVTLYRESGLRQVVENCHASCAVHTPAEPFGKSLEKKIRLIIPGNATPLQPGDRVFLGIGPEEIKWEDFLPAAVSELYELTWAKPLYWQGELSHWEGGA